MADLKPISQFATASSVEANTLLFVSTPNQNNGYDSEKVSASELGEALVNDFEYTQDLSTVSKKVTGGINENKSVIGYSYDEYDATTAYSKDDLCIYNNTLYKAKQATTGNLPTNTTYWEQTSIADEIGELKSDKTNFIRVGWGRLIETEVSNHSHYLVMISGVQVYLVWVAGETDINILRFTDMQTFNSSTGTWTDTISNRVFTRIGGASAHKLTVTTPNDVSLTIIG